MKRRIKHVRVVSLILLLVSLFVSVDLMLNYQYSLILNDGIACISLLHKVFGIFKDYGWTRWGFLRPTKLPSG